MMDEIKTVVAQRRRTSAYARLVFLMAVLSTIASTFLVTSSETAFPPDNIDATVPTIPSARLPKEHQRVRKTSLLDGSTLDHRFYVPRDLLRNGLSTRQHRCNGSNNPVGEAAKRDTGRRCSRRRQMLHHRSEQV